MTLFLLARGEAPVLVVEVAALFSIYAVFFWSTFLTSVWAWGYCLSSWLAAIRARLAGWLDLKGKPGASLALIGAVAIFVVALGLKPLLTVDDRGRIALDDVLCDVFPTQICPHLIRISADEAEKLDLLGKVCAAGVTAECLAKGLEFFKVNNEDAAQLWSKACDGGNARGCTNLGYLYDEGLGVEADASRAVALYGQGCDGGNAQGCTNLGLMHENGEVGSPNAGRANELYRRACEMGDARGCVFLGMNYRTGLGVDADAAEAARLHQQGCDGDDDLGCHSLAVLYRTGDGVLQDAARAQELFAKACDLGHAPSCEALATPAD